MLAEFQPTRRSRSSIEIVTFIMTVESVKEIDKQSYQVSGTDQASPHLHIPGFRRTHSNDRVRSLVPETANPGRTDDLQTGQCADDYKPDGSFMGVEHEKVSGGTVLARWIIAHRRKPR